MSTGRSILRGKRVVRDHRDRARHASLPRPRKRGLALFKAALSQLRINRLRYAELAIGGAVIEAAKGPFRAK
jgi:hypothetical protein